MIRDEITLLLQSTITAIPKTEAYCALQDSAGLHCSKVVAVCSCQSIVLVCSMIGYEFSKYRRLSLPAVAVIS